MKKKEGGGGGASFLRLLIPTLYPSSIQDGDLNQSIVIIKRSDPKKTSALQATPKSVGLSLSTDISFFPQWFIFILLACL